MRMDLILNAVSWHGKSQRSDLLRLTQAVVYILREEREWCFFSKHLKAIILKGDKNQQHARAKICLLKSDDYVKKKKGGGDEEKQGKQKYGA